MSKKATSIALSLLLASAGAACAYKEPVRQPEVILREAEELGILNAKAPFPGVLTSGQLTREQFVALSEGGYETFVNLRVPTEDDTGWERKLAGELAARYVSIPVDGAAGLTEENARKLSETLEEYRGPVVVYCSTGNRSGALFALEAYYVDGKSAKRALAIGKSAGLMQLEPAVREVLGLPAE